MEAQLEQARIEIKSTCQSVAAAKEKVRLLILCPGIVSNDFFSSHSCIDLEQYIFHEKLTSLYVASMLHLGCVEATIKALQTPDTEAMPNLGGAEATLSPVPCKESGSSTK